MALKIYYRQNHKENICGIHIADTHNPETGGQFWDYPEKEDPECFYKNGNKPIEPGNFALEPNLEQIRNVEIAARRHVQARNLRQQKLEELEDFLRENPEMENNVEEIKENTGENTVDVVVTEDTNPKQRDHIGNTVAAQYPDRHINIYSGELSNSTFVTSYKSQAKLPRPMGPKPFHPKSGNPRTF